MKEVILFILCWIACWLLLTAIMWFGNPGTEFRELAGNTTIGLISFFFGWMPGTIILSIELDRKKD